MALVVVWRPVGGGLYGDFPVDVVRIFPEARLARVTVAGIASAEFTVPTADLWIFGEVIEG